MMYGVMMYPRQRGLSEDWHLWIHWRDKADPFSPPRQLHIPFASHDAAWAEYNKLMPLRDARGHVADDHLFRVWQMEDTL